MYGNTNSLIPLLTKEYLGSSQFVIKEYFFLPTSCLPFKIVCLLVYSSNPVSPISSFHACRCVGSSMCKLPVLTPKKLLNSPHSLLELKFASVLRRSWAPQWRELMCIATMSCRWKRISQLSSPSSGSSFFPSLFYSAPWVLMVMIETCPIYNWILSHLRSTCWIL